MAEHGAHAASNFVSSTRPSIFEVVAQDNLDGILQPAFNHVCKVLAGKFPGKLGWLFRFGDEIYLTLNVVLQGYCLQRHCASYAEHFYGLRRIFPSGNNSKLSRAAYVRSLLIITCLPYLKRKIEAWFLRWRIDMADGRHSETAGLSYVRAVCAAYPYVHCTVEGAAFAYQLLYTIGRARTHSPWLHLSGCELAYEPGLGVPGISERDETFFQRLASGLSSAVSACVFGLQFVDHFYSTRDQGNAPSWRPQILTNDDVIQPPKKMNVEVAVDETHCPLCKKKRTLPTALSTSGFVFCYACIHAYVEANGRCPVSGYPSQGSHLIKLFYDPDSRG